MRNTVTRKKAVLGLCFLMFLISALPTGVLYAEPLASPSPKHAQAADELFFTTLGPGDNFAPFWDNVASISVILTINNGRAIVGGTVVANSGTTSITVNATLDRVNPNGTTTHINSWNNLRTNGSTWAWEATHMVARNHDYRLTLTATAVRNGVSETVLLSRLVRAN